MATIDCTSNKHSPSKYKQLSIPMPTHPHHTHTYAQMVAEIVMKPTY